MKRSRLATLAAAISVIAVLAFAAPVSAWDPLKISGDYGDFGSQPEHQDAVEYPGAKCGYSAADGTGTAYLRWIKVYHFLAAARDLTPNRDSQMVSSQVAIQRQTSSGWKTVAKSAIQKLTAYDDQSAKFTDPKVYVHGTSASQHFRAVLTLKWWRNGAVEGTVKARIEFYSVKWTVGSPTYVYSDACDGAAD